MSPGTLSSSNAAASKHDVLESHYPQDCPFCRISAAYPPSAQSPVPSSPDSNLVSPQCHLVLSTPHVLAFLDIMPMAPGHILVTTRQHYAKLTDLFFSASSRTLSSAQRTQALESSRELGLWLPRVSAALCKVTGIQDWNVVQNNGVRAAQVVPHVHFHLIPRYAETKTNEERKREPMGLARSWKMFGRGTREDLDDEEGAKMAEALRDALREMVEGSERLFKL